MLNHRCPRLQSCLHVCVFWISVPSESGFRPFNALRFEMSGLMTAGPEVITQNLSYGFQGSKRSTGIDDHLSITARPRTCTHDPGVMILNFGRGLHWHHNHPIVRDEDFNDLIHFQGLNPLPRGKYVHKLCIEFHGHHNIVFFSLKYIQK